MGWIRGGEKLRAPLGTASEGFGKLCDLFAYICHTFQYWGRFRAPGKSHIRGAWDKIIANITNSVKKCRSSLFLDLL